MEEFKNLSINDQNEEWDENSESDSEGPQAPGGEGAVLPMPMPSPPLASWGRGRGRARAIFLENTRTEPPAAQLPQRPIGPIRPFLGVGRGRGFFYGFQPKKPAEFDVPGIGSDNRDQSSCVGVSYGKSNKARKPVFTIPKAHDLAEVLESPKESDTKFCIANLHTKRHNRFNIITKKSYNNMVWVKDEMNLHTRVAGHLKVRPCVGEVIVVRHPNRKVSNHIRAYVRSMHVRFEELVEITCVDLGRRYVLPWREMWAPNKEIFEFPPFGYEVEVEGIEDFSPLIFFEDYSDLVNGLLNTPQSVQIVGETDDGLYRVRLTNDNEVGAHKLFSTWINSLKKFEWERTYDIGMYKNDEEIFNRGRWNELYETFRNAILPSVTPFEAVVVGISGDENSENHNNLFIKPIHEYMDVHAQTLEAQLERYMSIIQPVPFYPSILEEFCGLLPEKYKCGDKWRRLVRLDYPGHVHYDVDNHRVFEVNIREEAIQYRRICPEFFRIPKLIMDAKVYYGGVKDEVYSSLFAQTFAVGQKLWFTLYEDDEELVDDEIVHVRCREFEERLIRERESVIVDDQLPM